MRRVITERAKGATLYFGLFGITLAGLIINLAFVSHVGQYFFTPTEELAKSFGLSDRASYLRLALDLQDLEVEPDNFWILALWPPGTPVVFAVFEALPGTLLPYLVVLIALLWAIPPYLFISASQKSPLLAIAAISLWTFNPIFHNWLFSGWGAFSSESLGLPIFAAAVAFLLRSPISTKPQRDLLFSGALLGLSLYFRATLLPITMLAFFAVLAVLIAFLIFYRLQQQALFGLEEHIKSLRNLIAVYLKYGLIVLLVAAPWAVLVFTVVNPGNISWSANEYLWVQKWTSSEELASQGGAWLVEGGANWPCILNAPQCSVFTSEALGREDFEVVRNAAISTLFSNPGAFFALRAENLFYAFLSLPGSTIGFNQTPATALSYVVFVTAYLIVVMRFHSENLMGRLAVNLVFVVSVIVSLATFAIMAVYHIETRYFLPGHVVSLLAAGFFMVYIHRKRSATFDPIRSVP